MSKKRFRKEFPIEKYKFEVVDNTVIATSTYAGKPISAKAKCDPRDEFNLERGKELAAARCGLKVAQKRFNHAKDVLEKRSDNFRIAFENLFKAYDFAKDSAIAFDDYLEKVNLLEFKMGEVNSPKGIRKTIFFRKLFLK